MRCAGRSRTRSSPPQTGSRASLWTFTTGARSRSRQWVSHVPRVRDRRRRRRLHPPAAARQARGAEAARGRRVAPRGRDSYGGAPVKTIDAEPMKREMAVENPATGEVIASVPTHTPEQVAAIVERARAAQPPWAALGFDGRGE